MFTTACETHERQIGPIRAKNCFEFVNFCESVDEALSRTCCSWQVVGKMLAPSSTGVFEPHTIHMPCLFSAQCITLRFLQLSYFSQASCFVPRLVRAFVDLSCFRAFISCTVSSAAVHNCSSCGLTFCLSALRLLAFWARIECLRMLLLGNLIWLATDLQLRNLHDYGVCAGTSTTTSLVAESTNAQHAKK